MNKKKWNVLMQVEGWVSYGEVEAETEQEALELARDVDHPNEWDPTDLYDVLERAAADPEVEEK